MPFLSLSLRRINRRRGCQRFPILLAAHEPTR